MTTESGGGNSHVAATSSDSLSSASASPQHRLSGSVYINLHRSRVESMDGRVYSRGDSTPPRVMPRRQTIEPVRLRNLADQQHSQQQSNRPSKIIEALYQFRASNKDELSLEPGSMVTVVETADSTQPGWMLGMADGRVGYFPTAYAQLLGGEPTTIRSDQLDLKGAIGDGNFAIVREGIYSPTPNERIPVAVKIPRFEDIAHREDTLAAMKREAVMLTSLQHPNIVRLYGLSQEMPNVGLVMELCQGRSLTGVYRRLKDLTVTPQVIVDWLLQIASGMRYLSSHNYVHRDLKADNVLVLERPCFEGVDVGDARTLVLHPSTTGPNGECESCGGRKIDRLTLKISDFGLTRSTIEQTTSSSSGGASSNGPAVAGGTAAWMAPETVRGHLANAHSSAADVWSFGVVIWELVTREIPYANVEQHVVKYRVGRGETLEATRIPDEPVDIRGLTTLCWKAEPSERPTFDLIVNKLADMKQLLKESGQLSVLQPGRVDERFARFIQESGTTTTTNRVMANGTHRRTNSSHAMEYAATSSSAFSDESPQQPTHKTSAGTKKKIGKNDIGKPQDMVHVIRGDRTVDHCFKLVANDEKDTRRTGPATVGATEGRSMLAMGPSVTRSHPNLNQVISPSSPIPGHTGESGGTLRRANAMKKKKSGGSVTDFAISSVSPQPPRRDSHTSIAESTADDSPSIPKRSSSNTRRDSGSGSGLKKFLNLFKGGTGSSSATSPVDSVQSTSTEQKQRHHHHSHPQHHPFVMANTRSPLGVGFITHQSDSQSPAGRVAAPRTSAPAIASVQPTANTVSYSAAPRSVDMIKRSGGSGGGGTRISLDEPMPTTPPDFGKTTPEQPYHVMLARQPTTPTAQGDKTSAACSPLDRPVPLMSSSVESADPYIMMGPSSYPHRRATSSLEDDAPMMSAPPPPTATTTTTTGLNPLYKHFKPAAAVNASDSGFGLTPPVLPPKPNSGGGGVAVSNANYSPYRQAPATERPSTLGIIPTVVSSSTTNSAGRSPTAESGVAGLSSSSDSLLPPAPAPPHENDVNDDEAAVEVERRLPHLPHTTPRHTQHQPVPPRRPPLKSTGHPTAL